jgi:hypothetical protein
MDENRKAVLEEKRGRLIAKLGTLASKTEQTKTRVGQIEAELKALDEKAKQEKAEVQAQVVTAADVGELKV